MKPLDPPTPFTRDVVHHVTRVLQKSPLVLALTKRPEEQCQSVAAIVRCMQPGDASGTIAALVGLEIMMNSTKCASGDWMEMQRLVSACRCLVQHPYSPQGPVSRDSDLRFIYDLVAASAEVKAYDASGVVIKAISVLSRKEFYTDEHTARVVLKGVAAELEDIRMLILGVSYEKTSKFLKACGTFLTPYEPMESYLDFFTRPR